MPGVFGSPSCGPQRESLRFVECAVLPGTSLVTDDSSGYASLAKRGYRHLAIAERGDPQVAEEYLPIIHLVFANLKTSLNGIHHGVNHQHLQAYLNEFTFRFNRSVLSAQRLRSLLGIAATSPHRPTQSFSRSLAAPYMLGV